MRKFALYFTSFALVLALVVVTAVPAFAEEGIDVEEGYNIDCVPYSPYISSLVVTDNTEEAYVYYSASKARTYSATASTFSVSSTSSSDSSTDYLYSFSDYLSLFPAVNWSPAVTNSPAPYEYPISDSQGKRGFKILYGDVPTRYHTAVKNLTELKSGNKYSFSFTIVQNALTTGTMYFRFFDSSDESKYVDVFSMTAASGTGAALKLNKTITGNIIIPDDWSGSISVRFRSENLGWSEPTIYINDFTIIDITNENLDKSLDKFGDRIDSIINPSEPYNEFDDGSFQGSADELKDAENALPSVNHDEFQSLADSIDLSEYSNTFAQINNLFIRFVDTVGITPLIFFALFFGICIFILGRKLSGG